MGDFVRPEVVRLYLVDVHRRALADHLARIQTLKQPEELAAAKRLTPSLEINVKDAERRGRWIDVKKRLNAGESRKMFARVVKEMTAGEKALLDPEKVGLTQLQSYVLGWSFTDDDGHPEPFSHDALDNLDPDLYAEMIKAVDQHQDAQTAERDKEKNDQGGETSASATLSSPSRATGVLSGSAN